jgi:hypothetical protein
MIHTQPFSLRELKMRQIKSAHRFVSASYTFYVNGGLYYDANNKPEVADEAEVDQQFQSDNATTTEPVKSLCCRW